MEILTPLLKVFTFNLVGGAGRLTPDALWLLSIFFGGELILTGVWFVLRREVDWAALVWKSITAAVFLWLITNWVPLTKTLVKGFVGAGLKVGGDALEEKDFTDPDSIALYGLNVTAVVFQQIGEYTGLAAIKMLPVILFSGLTALLVVLLYFCMAVWLFLSLLEFYLSTSVSVILLPWGMFSKTAWITEKALAHVFASGVRLLVLATILGSALPIMYGQAPSPIGGQGFAASLATAFRLLLASIALLGLCWRANAFAQGLVHGGPALTLTDGARVFQQLTTHLTSLGTTLQALTDVMARTDPSHPARQPLPSRRNP